MEIPLLTSRRKAIFLRRECAARSVLLIPQAKTGLQYVEIK
ncbi:hypothetical protein [Paenibacillus polymyxa]|nr:hypothetical protein [Paenibacillus polymyxa]